MVQGRSLSTLHGKPAPDFINVTRGDCSVTVTLLSTASGISSIQMVLVGDEDPAEVRDIK